MASHSEIDCLPLSQAPKATQEEPELPEELDLSSLEKLARESVIVRSFQGAPKLTPPPAPRKDASKSGS